jgi:hypothetical protein
MKLEAEATVSWPVRERRLVSVFALIDRYPLIWALPVQGGLLFYQLSLLEPWRDEWFTFRAVTLPLDQIRSFAAAASYPPLYYFALHWWLGLVPEMNQVWMSRAMSVMWALAATAILDFIWLRKQSPRTRAMVLLLWILSPCLLLYARMARYYSMQVAMGLLTFGVGQRWLERPRDALRLLTFALACAALLYTHYLAGIAVPIAIASVFALRPEPRFPVRAILLAALALVTISLYLPAIGSLTDAVRAWGISDVGKSPGFMTDQLVRTAWWWISFTFGESLSTPVILLGVVLTPVILYSIYRGIQSQPDWLGMVVIAAAIAYIGVTRWTGFSFTPARELFVLPFFLMLVIRGIGSIRRGELIFGVMAIVYLSGDYEYFARRGYLNKEYCVPYRAMASVINDHSPVDRTKLLADEFGTFPAPLLNQLRQDIRVIHLEEDEQAESVLKSIGKAPDVIWLLRHTHDDSPDRWVTALEQNLASSRSEEVYYYLPYSVPERWILARLRGSGQPAYFMTLRRFEGASSESSENVH